MKRAKWKGFYIKPKNLKNTTKISRSSSIVPKFIGKTLKIHSGKNFKEVTIIKEMLGHKFGEFSKTRANFTFKKKKKKK